MSKNATGVRRLGAAPLKAETIARNAWMLFGLVEEFTVDPAPQGM